MRVQTLTKSMMSDVHQSAESPLRILAIAGSIRRASWNRRLLDAAAALAPEGVRVEPFDLRDVPIYDADLDTDELRPEPVRRLKQAVADADALLIATPEFNHSIPGVLQNAIDWISRPAMKSALADKPVGIMGASPGALGAARAQQHLKLVLMATLAQVMPHPGVSIGMVAEKFAADGTLAHEPTRRFVAAFMAQLAGWTRRLRGTGTLRAA
jgi:chromate reductase, NAD(P)H dehydrogenase (quinone)